MCYGPVQVLWQDQLSAAQQPFDNKLILFAAFDLIEIAAEKSYDASPNMYEFIFMARERIVAENGRINIFFPFPTDPMPMRAGCNDTARRRKYLSWQMRFFEQTLRTQDRSHAHSFGWDEKEARHLLPPAPQQTPDIADLFRYHLQRALKDPMAPNLDLTIAARPYADDPMFAESYQRFVITLNGTMEAGEFFHIFIEADTAPGEPLEKHPCGGEALLYHYDKKFGEMETSGSTDPLRLAPVVPCTLLQVAILFPRRAQVRPRSYAKSTLQNPRRLTSPTGNSFPDWRWFVICNAHRGFQRRSFMTWWELEDCPDRAERGAVGLHLLVKDELLHLISDSEQPWVEYGLQNIHTLSKREKTVARRLAQSQTVPAIADNLHLAHKTVEKHVTKIYRKLGLDDIQNQAPELRKAVLLTKILMLWQLN